MSRKLHPQLCTPSDEVDYIDRTPPRPTSACSSCRTCTPPPSQKPARSSASAPRPPPRAAERRPASTRRSAKITAINRKPEQERHATDASQALCALSSRDGHSTDVSVGSGQHEHADRSIAQYPPAHPPAPSSPVQARGQHQHSATQI